MSTKDAKNMVIALEPEAASVCCHRLNIAQYNGKEKYTFPHGTKYMVLDCGGRSLRVGLRKRLRCKTTFCFPMQSPKTTGVLNDISKICLNMIRKLTTK